MQLVMYFNVLLFRNPSIGVFLDLLPPCLLEAISAFTKSETADRAQLCHRMFRPRPRPVYNCSCARAPSLSRGRRALYDQKYLPRRVVDYLTNSIHVTYPHQAVKLS